MDTLDTIHRDAVARAVCETLIERGHDADVSALLDSYGKYAASVQEADAQ